MANEQPKSLSQTLRELWDLLKDYARQETLEPLKGLGRYIGFGIGGSLLMGIGVIFGVMAILRMLQHEFDFFDANYSPIVYLVALLATVVVIALAGRQINKEPKRRP